MYLGELETVPYPQLYKVQQKLSMSFCKGSPLSTGVEETAGRQSQATVQKTEMEPQSN